jgi:hypothetical protein
VVVAGEAEVFLNFGRSAMNSAFAAERPDRVVELGRRFDNVWYYGGFRATVANSEQWRADGPLRLSHSWVETESFQVGGRRTGLFRLLDPANRQGRLVRPLEDE